MATTPKRYAYGDVLKTESFRMSEKASAPAKPMRCTPAIWNARIRSVPMCALSRGCSRLGSRNNAKKRKNENTSLTILVSLDPEPNTSFQSFFMTMNKRITEKKRYARCQDLLGRDLQVLRVPHVEDRQHEAERCEERERHGG
mmetsp:Transcript_10880/g.26074  ORF Transcript_10880/g.26074 Transcript_10880/m.26074 type:complete len:143 (-) Transcript_10880:331-759(-)